MRAERLLPALFFLIATFLSFIASPAEAEVRAGAVTLSPMVGGYRFDGDQNLKNRPIYSLALGYNFSRHWATEAVAGFVRTEVEDTDFDFSIYHARLDFLYHFTPEAPATLYLAAGVGGLIFDADGEGEFDDMDKDALVDYGLGMKAFLSDSVAVRFDARHIITAENEDFDGEEFQNFLITGGLSFQMGGREELYKPADADGDGVGDALDQCPDTPRGVAVDSVGCPADSDGDGVFDYLDRCPDTPPGTEVDRTGCPADLDGDGVPNYRDRCPDTPPKTKVDRFGCPEKEVPDSDGDGVPDAQDKCPNTPPEVPVNARGCPRDSDGDGVFDIDDACPDTAPGVNVGPDGCPVAVKVSPESRTLGVQFRSGKTEVAPRYHEELAAAAAFIQSHPGARIVVEGHTDSVGSAKSNLKLSQQRAESVRRYLVEKFGIEPDRVTARGFGETQPIADNATQEGRLKNRRVVITVVR